jgi:hypothetical protein
VKEAVLEGRVTRGMEPLMVHVALGRPDEEIKQGESVVWVYYRGESFQVHHPPTMVTPGLDPSIRTGGMGAAASQDPLSIQRQTATRGQISPMRNPQIPEPPPMPVVVRDSKYDVEVVFRDGMVVAGSGVR